MVAIVAGAEYKQLSRNYTVERWDYSKGLVLHVQAGNGELYGWFNNPAASASSHWWVGKDGRIVQYLDPENHQSWAQAGGNAEWHSVETEGYPHEPLTPAQMAGVARIYTWGMNRFGWPAQLANTTSSKGFGWHGMGGSSWGGHTGCPGDARKAQRQMILDSITGGTPKMADNVSKMADDYMAGVNRPGDKRAVNGYVSVKQEIADCKTMLLAVSQRVEQLYQIVGRLQ